MAPAQRKRHSVVLIARHGKPVSPSGVDQLLGVYEVILVAEIPLEQAIHFDELLFSQTWKPDQGSQSQTEQDRPNLKDQKPPRPPLPPAEQDQGGCQRREKQRCGMADMSTPA